ncbi:tRNA (adenine(37)-N6)-methyltransferase [Amphibalanus amphitrite]|uniref:tRNA (Adenine(37)-N6)-methyltransferase n=1 Tax=Amphibalanus amphitrite TaxID=1232801 RepID=A0A6A4V727_AMPAM|nr:tRNA (adenine(37)-N6)-methyltransferase [Amphibalanus amphitrite]
MCGDTLHFSGHDLVDGTPVLDIKPYIREYDCPPDGPGGQSVASQSPAGSQASAEDCPAASEPADSRGSDTWLSRLQPERWTVSFTAWAESQLRRFSASESAGAHRLRCLRSAAELRAALVALLTADPRSVYRRTQS